MASLKLGSRMPIKYDECMKRTAELELCHLAVPREGREEEEKTHTQKHKADKEEILILHAPHHLVNIFLEMYIISFDSLYDSLSAAK